MPTFDEAFPTIVAELAGRYGRPGPHLWPDDTFERVVSALLGQSLERKTVEKAVRGLDEAGLLQPGLVEAEPDEVIDALRTAGVKSPPRALAPLLRLARWLFERFPDALENIHDEGLSTPALREELAGIPGIGPSTADAILLFGLGRLAYPVDRATYRILARHGWLDPAADYEEARALVEGQAAHDPERLVALSDWFEQVGRDYCRASVARCERCPLRELLPEGGPREPGE